MSKDPFTAGGFTVRTIASFCILVAAVAVTMTTSFGCDDSPAGGTPTLTDGGTGPTRTATDGEAAVVPGGAAVPTLTKVAPASAALGSIGPTVILTGTGFLPRSVVKIDGEMLETQFESETEIVATIPTAKLAKLGELEVTVLTPKPGGGETAPLAFAVENPPPEIIALAPLSIPFGSAPTPLAVVGSTFVNGSTIRFGAADLVTTFKDSEHLEGIIPANLLLGSKSVPVTVVTPAPGGGTSTVLAFTVSNPNVTITSVTPGKAVVGGADFPISVKGTGIAPGAKIVFNVTTLPTTAGGAGELTATVPTSELLTASDVGVAVANPAPGGGLSAAFTFHIENPVPTSTSFTPASIPAGSNPSDITVVGSGFVAGASKINVDGTDVAASTVVDPTHIKAKLTAVQLAKVGNLSIKVTTAAPGGGATSARPFPVVLAVPKPTAIDPPTLAVRTTDATITIRGTQFVATTTATAKGQPITVTPGTGAQFTAVVPAALLGVPGIIPIVVTNPGTGGGSSAPLNVTVACEAGGVDANLVAVGTPIALPTDFATALSLTRWTAESQCSSAQLSSLAAKQPGRYKLVQNATAAPVTLAAWTDCTNDGKGAAYLSFYRRTTPPSTDMERLACEGFVAAGSAHASPESGGSATCPGLTKANGGGITLGVCERAIVHVQSFNSASTTLTPPPTLKIQAE